MSAEIKPFSMDWNPIKREAPAWFRDAKFGLFFHWGPYSVPACENEWYSRNIYTKGLSQHEHHVEKYGKLSEFGYKDFYDQLTGENFDAEAWAELVERSGARYAGPVTEHADNFSLWDSQVNPANAVNYGPKRDIVGEFAEAVRKRDLKFIATFHHQWLWGWFMSTDPEADVYNPENSKFYGKATPLETKRYIPWQLPDNAFNETWMQKVIEVLDKYDPDLVYFDSRANIIAEAYKHKLTEHYYSKGSNRRDDTIISYKQSDFPEDVGILDIECGRFSDTQPFAWQTDDRLEAKRTWCYVEEPAYKSARDIIHQLADVVSKNGNLLLNVGPKKDGTFPEEATAVLYEVGDWLRAYGEAIYQTRPFSVYGEGATEIRDTNFDVSQIEAQTKKGVFDEEDQVALSAEDIRFTTNGNVLYAILLGKPIKDIAVIRVLAQHAGLGNGKIASIAMLGGADNLSWSLDEEGLRVQLPSEAPSEHANVLKITYHA